MQNALQLISLIISIATGVFALATVFVKPFRRWLFDSKVQKQKEEAKNNENRETYKGLLRNEILKFYYKRIKTKQIRQFEYENMEQMYRQYVTLGGNSFICRVWADMQTWDIVSPKDPDQQ